MNLPEDKIQQQIHDSVSYRRNNCSDKVVLHFKVRFIQLSKIIITSYKKNRKNLVYNINLFIFAPWFRQTAQLRPATKTNKTLDTMELNKEMTAQQSLQIISETFNKSRKDILSNSAKYFMLWGALLTVVSLVIYLLWHLSGKPEWNFLWFAMPVVGYPLAALMGKYNKAIPQNEVSKMLGGVWSVFGTFAIALSAIAISLVPMHVTLIIVIIMGLAECMSGVLLKNWPIIIGGFLLGVGGAVFAMLVKDEAQLLIFTLGGVLLLVTGFIMKLQYK